MSMATELNRFSISVSDELLEKIEDYRYTKRIPTRSKATLELIELGLKYIEQQQQNNKETE